MGRSGNEGPGSAQAPEPPGVLLLKPMSSRNSPVNGWTGPSADDVSEGDFSSAVSGGGWEAFELLRRRTASCLLLCCVMLKTREVVSGTVDFELKISVGLLA